MLTTEALLDHVLRVMKKLLCMHCGGYSACTIKKIATRNAWPNRATVS